jgi:hypothetical protein
LPTITLREARPARRRGICPMTHPGRSASSVAEGHAFEHEQTVGVAELFEGGANLADHVSQLLGECLTEPSMQAKKHEVASDDSGRVAERSRDPGHRWHMTSPLPGGLAMVRPSTSGRTRRRLTLRLGTDLQPTATPPAVHGSRAANGSGPASADARMSCYPGPGRRVHPWPLLACLPGHGTSPSNAQWRPKSK